MKQRQIYGSFWRRLREIMLLEENFFMALDKFLNLKTLGALGVSFLAFKINIWGS